jgi:GT2 family glycosyltransferase
VFHNANANRGSLGQGAYARIMMYRSSSTVTFGMTFILLPLYICDLTIFKNRLSNWRHEVRFANKFLQAFIYLFMKRNGKKSLSSKNATLLNYELAQRP